MPDVAAAINCSVIADMGPAFNDRIGADGDILPDDRVFGDNSARVDTFRGKGICLEYQRSETAKSQGRILRADNRLARDLGIAWGQDRGSVRCPGKRNIFRVSDERKIALLASLIPLRPVMTRF